MINWETGNERIYAKKKYQENLSSDNSLCYCFSEKFCANTFCSSRRINSKITESGN